MLPLVASLLLQLNLHSLRGLNLSSCIFQGRVAIPLHYSHNLVSVSCGLHTIPSCPDCVIGSLPPPDDQCQLSWQDRDFLFLMSRPKKPRIPRRHLKLMFQCDFCYISRQKCVPLGTKTSNYADFRDVNIGSTKYPNTTPWFLHPYFLYWDTVPYKNL